MSSATKPFPVELDVTPPGTPLWELAPSSADSKTTTTPNSSQTLLTYTVPVSKKLQLRQARVNCRQTSAFSVLEGSALIASGVLGAAEPDAVFTWIVPREIAAGVTVKIDFLQTGGPAIDVYAHFQASVLDA